MDEVLLELLTARKMSLTIEFEWAHDAAKFAEVMRKYRLIVAQYGSRVSVLNPFDTER